MVIPYSEVLLSETEVIRTFTESIDGEELKWHWDEEDRIIEALHETDWMIQFDNELPIKIEGKIEIKKGVWHRLIKGNSNIRIKIKKIS
jgi:hypothetical protein